MRTLRYLVVAFLALGVVYMATARTEPIRGKGWIMDPYAPEEPVAEKAAPRAKVKQEDGSPIMRRPWGTVEEGAIGYHQYNVEPMGPVRLRGAWIGENWRDADGTWWRIMALCDGRPGESGIVHPIDGGTSVVAGDYPAYAHDFRDVQPDRR